jgi:hypothetical protein
MFYLSVVPFARSKMHTFSVEPVLSEKLFGLTGEAILYDAEGRALGYFSPMPHHPPVSELQLEPPLSIAEVEELRKKNRGGKPLSEILGRLGL